MCCSSILLSAHYFLNGFKSDNDIIFTESVGFEIRFVLREPEMSFSQKGTGYE